MNILVLGSGGREHALAWKIRQSPLCQSLFIAPGNAGTALCGENIPVAIDDFTALKKVVEEKSINMVVVGPEMPLVAGIHDFFLEDKKLKPIPVIGPTKAGAMLEGSKAYAKQFMEKYGIPTARHKTFTKANLQEAFHFLESLSPPFVLKASGLAAGKGVVIAYSLKRAKEELRQMVEEEKFGAASRQVVIEEFLPGKEFSVFILTDGVSYLLLPPAKDYKRVGEGDTGPNTGGMGAISPVSFVNEAMLAKVEIHIIRPTLEGLQKEGISYKGFIYFGLMAVNDEPYVLEYNVRLGDPEAQVVLPRIKNDLVELFNATVSGNIGEMQLIIDERSAAAVVLAAGGYPDHYEKGKIISGLEQIKDSIVFHAGTKQNSNQQILTEGGRVLTITSLANNLKEALALSYSNIKQIAFEDVYYRRDIGFDVMD